MSILFSVWIWITSTCIPLLSDFSKSNYLENQLGEYHSIEGHPKAKGVNLKIKVPKEWLIKEGDRPNIVVKFISGFDNYLIQLIDSPTFISKKQAREVFSDPEYFDNKFKELQSVFNGAKISNQQIVTIDNYPAIEFVVSGNVERLGMTIDVKMKVWQIFYEDKIINLRGAALSGVNTSSMVNLLSEVTYSIVFPDQHATP